MLNLMKHEARRQMFSKGVIVGIFLVLVAAFFWFCRIGQVTGMGIVLSLMSLETMVVFLLAPTEHCFIFHNDIHSGQGTMQFLLPKKSTAVLGAKVLVSLLQTVIFYGLFFTVVPYCEQLAVEKYGFATGYVGKVLDTIFEMTHSVNVISMIVVWMSIVVTVLFLSNLGLFIIAIPLPLENLKGLVRFAGYIVAFALIVFVRMKVKELLLIINTSSAVINIFEIVYLVGVNLILFFGTAKLLENEVSIE